MPDYNKFMKIKKSLSDLTQMVSEYGKDFSGGGMAEDDTNSSYSEPDEGDTERGGGPASDLGYDSPDAQDGGSNPPDDLSPEFDSKAKPEDKKKKMSMISSMLKTSLSKRSGGGDSY